MAISSSSDWSLASSHYPKRTHKLTLNSPCNSVPFLSLLCSTSRVLIVNSSNCPSPILEGQSSSTDSPLLDLKVQDFDQDSSMSIDEDNDDDTEDLNAVICSLLGDPKSEKLGYEHYQKAKDRPDFRPQKSTLHHLIRYLMRLKNWNLIWSLSEDFRKFNEFPDNSSCCRLISSCLRARRFKLVNNLLEIFGHEEEIAVSAFNTAMKGYNKLHMYSSAVTAYELMKSLDVLLDAESYGRIMEAHLKMGYNEKVVSLFEECQTSGIDWRSFGTQIYRILCESLGKSGKPFEALRYFREMTKNGLPEDPSFYSSLIYSFVSIREVEMAEELLEEAVKKKMLRDPGVYLKLVLMYVEEGLVEKTLDVVSAMKQVNIRVSDCIFCAIVNGFSKKRGLKSAVKVYEKLISQGCDPGQVTYASILNVYSRIGLYSEAEEVFLEMDNKGFDRCVVAYSSMVSMYGKTGRPRDAMRLVAKMKERGLEPNVWIYNSLLDMHGKVLNLRQVEKIWKEMKRRKVLPDKVSYTSVISAYSKAREFDMCMQYYNEYRLNGGRLDRTMAGIMVGVFSKTTRVDELVKLLQDMKAEGTGLDERLYRSSLNALRDAGLQLQAKWVQQNFEANLR